MPRPVLAQPDTLLRCMSCGYNLTGLAGRGRCPECGVRTLSSACSCPLASASPALLRTLQLGVQLEFLGWVIVVPVGVVAAALMAWVSWPGNLGTWPMLLGFAVATSLIWRGSLLVSRHDPLRFEQTARGLGRVSLHTLSVIGCLNAALLVCACFVFALPSHFSRNNMMIAVGLIVVVAPIFLTPLLMVAWWVTAPRTHANLALLAGDPSLARGMRTVEGFGAAWVGLFALSGVLSLAAIPTGAATTCLLFPILLLMLAVTACACVLSAYRLHQLQQTLALEHVPRKTDEPHSGTDPP